MKPATTKPKRPRAATKRPLTTARNTKVTKVAGAGRTTRKSEIFGAPGSGIAPRRSGRSATSAIP